MVIPNACKGGEIHPRLIPGASGPNLRDTIPIRYNDNGDFMKDLSDIDTQRKRDFDDLQHEISGVDNGRMKRFLNATDERTP